MPAEGARNRRIRAFSLLELLIVLALLALVAVLVAPAALRMSLGDPRDQAMAELTESLGAARLDALQDAQERVTHIVRTEPGLTVSWADRKVVWIEWPLAIVGDAQRVADDAEVRFAPLGRANRREIRFIDTGSDRIWTIEFDPVSGHPGWRRIDDGVD